jgi:hypothetical protein
MHIGCNDKACDRKASSGRLASGRAVSAKASARSYRRSGWVKSMRFLTLLLAVIHRPWNQWVKNRVTALLFGTVLSSLRGYQHRSRRADHPLGRQTQGGLWGVIMPTPSTSPHYSSLAYERSASRCWSESCAWNAPRSAVNTSSSPDQSNREIAEPSFSHVASLLRNNS